MRHVFALLMIVGLGAGSAFGDEGGKKISLPTNVQALGVGVATGVATAVADVVTDGNAWILTWFAESLLRGDVVKSLAKDEGQREFKTSQGVANLGSYLGYALTFSKFHQRGVDLGLYAGLAILPLMLVGLGF